MAGHGSTPSVSKVKKVTLTLTLFAISLSVIVTCGCATDGGVLDIQVDVPVERQLTHCPHCGEPILLTPSDSGGLNEEPEK